MRPLKAERIDELTAMLKKSKPDIIGWLESDDVRESVGLPKLSVQTCVVCAEILTPEDKASCAIAGLKEPHCSKHAGAALAEKMKGESANAEA
jgi:hypothetical protein